MTNARDQPTVGREIVAEIESADRIDLVLAFIRWTGVRDLLPVLRRHTDAGKPVRVITTTCTGSTELRALQALAEAGVELRVSYDTASTRLHAKAWCFHPSTEFSTVYIGSSNLTFSAQITGREWNVRASERRNSDLIETFDRVFETYWADTHFEPFDAHQFAQAPARQVDDSIATPSTIEPYPFKRQILEQLKAKRHRGRNPGSLANLGVVLSAMLVTPIMGSGGSSARHSSRAPSSRMSLKVANVADDKSD
ncbi:MAG: phospholipase D-like domain-containing protein [Aquihabitans sp.]